MGDRGGAARWGEERSGCSLVMWHLIMVCVWGDAVLGEQSHVAMFGVVT